MRYKKISTSFFEKNREKLCQSLPTESVAIIHSNDEFPRNGNVGFPFRQRSSMFYFSGLDQEKSILCLYPDHFNLELREVVFTIEPDEVMTTWFGHKLSKKEVSTISGVKTIKWLSEFDDVLNELMKSAKHIYLDISEHNKAFSDIRPIDLRFFNSVRKSYPTHSFHQLRPIVHALRSIKEPEEIKLIESAVDITNKAFHRVLKFVRPGKMEFEVEAEIIYEFIRNGSSGPAYQTIVASGEDTCILHYTSNDKTLMDGDLLLLDFGAEYANYASDCSRTIPVNGKFTDRQRDCYNAVLRVMNFAAKKLVPGATIDKFHMEVCLFMEKELIGLGLFSEEDVKNQKMESPLFFNYYMHGTSHFIGLDVHDAGSRYQKLEKGMVMSCEPGIYIIGERIGIRLENDILVDDVPIDLMENIPILPEEIEALMVK